jgi:putative tricarboxylic transport membrane protein
MSVGTIMLVVSLAIIHGIWRSGGGKNPFNYDEERPGIDSFKAPGKGVWHYLLWLIGLALLIALTGFFIALNVFFVSFLRMEANPTWIRTVILTAAADAMIMFLSWLMTLDLPLGLLQYKFLDLPWPVGPI